MFNKDFIQEQRLVYMHENTKNEHQTKYEHLPYYVEEPTATRIRRSLENHVKQLHEWKESKKLIEEFKADFAQLSAEQQSRFYSLRQTYRDDVLTKIKQSKDFNTNLFTQAEVADTMRDILNGLLTLKYVDKTKMKGFDVAIQVLKQGGEINNDSIFKINQGVSDIQNGLDQIAEDEMRVISRDGIKIELVVTDSNNQCIVSSKKYPNVRKKIEDTGASNFPENLKNELKNVKQAIAMEKFLDEVSSTDQQGGKGGEKENVKKDENRNPFEDDPLPALPPEEAIPDASRMGGLRATEPMKENGRKNKRMLALFNRFLDDWKVLSMIKKVEGEYIYEDGGNVLDIHFPALLDAFDDPSVNDQRSKAILKKCKLQIRFQPNSNPPIYLLSIENTWGSSSKAFKFDPKDLSTKTELVSKISEAIQSVDEKHLLEEIVKEAKGNITIEEDVDPGILKIVRSGLESRKMHDEDGFHTGTQKPKPGLNLRISSTMIKVLQETSDVTKPYDVNKLIEDGFEIQKFVITHCTKIVPK